MDLERLDEALGEFAMFEADGPLDWHEKPVVEAARAYRDLANGERVEPDYEAAERIYNVWWLAATDPHQKSESLSSMVKRAVDAAIGGKLLVFGGERVKWCEVHESSGDAMSCLVSRVNWPPDDPCRIVSRILVDPSIEEKSGSSVAKPFPGDS